MFVCMYACMHVCMCSRVKLMASCGLCLELCDKKLRVGRRCLSCSSTVVNSSLRGVHSRVHVGIRRVGRQAASFLKPGRDSYRTWYNVSS